jgi:hypothetical protein
VYFLRAASAEQVSHVHYILMLDPGGKAQFGDCDNKKNPSGGDTLADWLASNPANHLTVISGDSTANDGHKAFVGTYLQPIKNRKLTKQVTVCNHDKLGHQAVFDRYASKAHLRYGGYLTDQKAICPYGIPPLKW